jgi:hypothetical protein
MVETSLLSHFSWLLANIFVARFARYTPAVPRAVLTVAVAGAALVWPFASIASADWPGALAAPAGERASHQDDSKLTLRVRTRLGPWKQSLYLKLNKTRLSSFSVCGIRNWNGTERFDCEAAAGRLPSGNFLRIEQSPIAKALRRPDSPGWGMLGLTNNTRVGVVVSNNVTGNKYGTYRYRVTLRNVSGQVLATSNLVRVTWHR